MDSNPRRPCSLNGFQVSMVGIIKINKDNNINIYYSLFISFWLSPVLPSYLTLSGTRMERGFVILLSWTIPSNQSSTVWTFHRILLSVYILSICSLYYYRFLQHSQCSYLCGRRCTWWSHQLHNLQLRHMKQIRYYDHAGELLRNPQVGNYGLDMIKKL